LRELVDGHEGKTVGEQSQRQANEVAARRYYYPPLDQRSTYPPAPSAIFSDLNRKVR
jgi:hypothetical protein